MPIERSRKGMTHQEILVHRESWGMELTGRFAAIAVHPEGMAENSRWSQRSGDHRNVVGCQSHPEGMPENSDRSCGIIEDFWHPSGMHRFGSNFPGVYAALRPLATVCHPFGMSCN